MYIGLNEIVFYKPNIKNDKLQIEKQIIFKNTLEISFYMSQHKIDLKNLGVKLKYPLHIKTINFAIQLFENKNVCLGGPCPINFPGNERYSLNIKIIIIYLYI